MSRKAINIGVVANDGTGDSLRAASSKINDNFTELYDAVNNITAYSLPIASPTVLGGVKVGAGLSINGSGVLSASVVNELTDLGIADGSSGQFLTTDGNGNFTFDDVPSALSALNDLTDVTITSPVVNNVLKYDGTGWVNGTASASVSALDDLTDVVISTPTNNQFLKYNGTNWVNSTVATGNPFDQDLNTTDFVEFASTTSGDFVLSGSGTPTIQSDTELHMSVGTRIAVTTKTPFRFPNMTTTERNAIVAQAGDVIFNTTTNKLQVYASGAWADLN